MKNLELELLVHFFSIIFFLFVLPASGIPFIDDLNRPYNKTTWLTAHNAHANRLGSGYLIYAQQNLSISGQLTAGVRAFMIDLYVYHPSNPLKSFKNALFPSKKTLEQLQESMRDGPSTDGQKAKLALCHEPNGEFSNCSMTRNFLKPVGKPQTFQSFLGIIKKFLEENPQEIVTLILENYAPSEWIIDAIQKAGVAELINKGLNTSTTLQNIITSGKRLIIYSDNIKGYPKEFFSSLRNFTETQYDLKSFPNCELRDDRQNHRDQLFIFNHFYAFAPWKKMKTQNSKSSIMKRINKCFQDRNKYPNFIALDFANKGDGAQVVKEINGLNK